MTDDTRPAWWDAAVDSSARAAYEYRRDVAESEWANGTWERLDLAVKDRYVAAAQCGLTAALPVITAAHEAELAKASFAVAHSKVETTGMEYVANEGYAAMAERDALRANLARIIFLFAGRAPTGNVTLAELRAAIDGTEPERTVAPEGISGAELASQVTEAFVKSDRLRGAQ